MASGEEAMGISCHMSRCWKAGGIVVGTKGGGGLVKKKESNGSKGKRCLHCGNAACLADLGGACKYASMTLFLQNFLYDCSCVHEPAA